MPKKALASTSNGQVVFDLTIPVATIATSYQQVLQSAANNAEIKGFRKGKAPIAMVEKSIDKSRLYAQVLDRVIPVAYAEELKSRTINPIIDPQITPKEFEEGKDWVFTVTTAVKPEVELGDYKKYVGKAITTYNKTKMTAPAEASAKEGHEHDATLTIVFDSLLKEAKVKVAPILIDQETKSQLSNLVKQLEQLKLTVADFAKSQKKTEEELVAEYKKTAETNLKLELILDKLVTTEDPAVTPDEIAKLKPNKGQEAYAKYVIQKQKVVDLLIKL